MKTDILRLVRQYEPIKMRHIVARLILERDEASNYDVQRIVSKLVESGELVQDGRFHYRSASMTDECQEYCSVTGCNNMCDGSIPGHVGMHECAQHRGQGRLDPVPCVEIIVKVGKITAEVRRPMLAEMDHDNEENAARLADQLVRAAVQRFYNK